MTYVPHLNEFQVGVESTRGTSVAGTIRLMGVEAGADINPDHSGEIDLDIRKSLAPRPIATFNKKAGMGSIPLLVNYDQDMIPFLNALLGSQTPSGSDPYTWTWDAVYAAPTVDPLTVIKGGPAGVYKLEGAVVNGWTFSGETGKRLKSTFDLLGINFTTGALAGLSDRVVTPMNGHEVEIFMEAAGGTPGTTSLDPDVFNFELQVQPGRANRQALGSVNVAGDQLEGDWTGTLKLGMFFESATKTIYEAALAAASPLGKICRIAATSGSKSLKVDFAGKFLAIPTAWEEFEQSHVINMTLDASYDTSWGEWLAVELINSVASV